MRHPAELRSVRCSVRLLLWSLRWVLSCARPARVQRFGFWYPGSPLCRRLHHALDWRVQPAFFASFSGR